MLYVWMDSRLGEWLFGLLGERMNEMLGERVCERLGLVRLILKLFSLNFPFVP